jgi:hypothetical protein
MELTTKGGQNYELIWPVQKVHKQLVWRTKMYMQFMPYPTSASSHLKCLLPLFVSAYICMCCFYFSAAYVLMCFNFIYVLLCFVLCFYIWFWCMIWCYVVLCIYLYSRFKSTLGLMLICCLCIYIPTLSKISLLTYLLIIMTYQWWRQ